jgi:hypothetical protein
MTIHTSLPQNWALLAFVNALLVNHAAEAARVPASLTTTITTITTSVTTITSWREKHHSDQEGRYTYNTHRLQPTVTSWQMADDVETDPLHDLFSLETPSTTDDADSAIDDHALDNEFSELPSDQQGHTLAQQDGDEVGKTGSSGGLNWSLGAARQIIGMDQIRGRQEE